MHREPKRKGLKYLPHASSSVFDKLAKPEPDNPMKRDLLKYNLIRDLLRANGQENVSPNHPRLHRQFVQKIRAFANISAAFTVSHKAELALLANVDFHSICLIKDLLELNRRLSGNKILKVPAARIEACAAVELGRNFRISWDSDDMIVAPKQKQQYKSQF